MVSKTERKPQEDSNGIAFLEAIHAFLSRKKVTIDTDIEKVKRYILEDDTFSLFSTLENISEIICCLDEHFTDNTMHRILEVFSINFYLFKNDFPFGSVLRQLLRVCGLVLSCIWQLHDIENCVCHHLDKGDKTRSTVSKDKRELKRFASYLHEIEIADNILEKHITDMKSMGSFCRELNSLIALKERAISDPRLIVMAVKMSILQLSILWQMYAVEKTPGHSYITANNFKRVILMHKDDDFKFVEEFKESHLFLDNHEDMMLVKKYLACIECSSLETFKLTSTQEKELMSMIIAPMLEEVQRKRRDLLTSNFDDQ